MKRICFAAMVIAASSPASAQISACRVIEKGNERLACYDGLFPRSKPGKDGKVRKPVSYDEEGLKEEAKMRKLLSPICKDCGLGK